MIESLIWFVMGFTGGAVYMLGVILYYAYRNGFRSYSAFRSWLAVYRDYHKDAVEGINTLLNEDDI